MSCCSRRRRHHCRYRSRVSSQIRETVLFDAIGSSKTSSSAASTSLVDRPLRKPLITNDSKAWVRATPLPRIRLSNPSLLRITNPRALQAHCPARRLDRPFLVAVAVTDRLLSALITAAAEELADLILKCLLQDQPGTEAPDRLDRVLLAANTGQHLIQFRAEPLARGYLLHAGVPPSSTCSGSKRRLRPSIQFPRLMGRDPATDFYGERDNLASGTERRYGSRTAVEESLSSEPVRGLNSTTKVTSRRTATSLVNGWCLDYVPTKLRTSFTMRSVATPVSDPSATFSAMRPNHPRVT